MSGGLDALDVNGFRGYDRLWHRFSKDYICVEILLHEFE